jgi:hypothetical protein
MSGALQDDLKRFVSEPQPPPQGIEIPGGRKDQGQGAAGSQRRE